MLYRSTQHTLSSFSPQASSEVPPNTSSSRTDNRLCPFSTLPKSISLQGSNWFPPHKSSELCWQYSLQAKSTNITWDSSELPSSCSSLEPMDSETLATSTRLLADLEAAQFGHCLRTLAVGSPFLRACEGVGGLPISRSSRGRQATHLPHPSCNQAWSPPTSSS